MMKFDVVALAKRINLRRREFNAAHDRRVRITPAMSRILENDPDYVPHRKRTAMRRKPSRNPSVRTLVKIAAALGTTVGDLLGEPFPLAPAERVVIVEGLALIDRILHEQRRL